MGYHHILGQSNLLRSHHSIGLSMIFRSMGRWLPGYSRRNPEIEVSMISNLSRMYRAPSARGWRRWTLRLGKF